MASSFVPGRVRCHSFRVCPFPPPVVKAPLTSFGASVSFLLLPPFLTAPRHTFLSPWASSFFCQLDVTRAFKAVIRLRVFHFIRYFVAPIFHPTLPPHPFNSLTVTLFFPGVPTFWPDALWTMSAVFDVHRRLLVCFSVLPAKDMFPLFSRCFTPPLS